jgi:hypothetical protein
MQHAANYYVSTTSLKKPPHITPSVYTSLAVTPTYLPIMAEFGYSETRHEEAIWKKPSGRMQANGFV